MQSLFFVCTNLYVKKQGTIKFTFFTNTSGIEIKVFMTKNEIFYNRKDLH